jgi:hypothetical protein
MRTPQNAQSKANTKQPPSAPTPKSDEDTAPVPQWTSAQVKPSVNIDALLATASECDVTISWQVEAVRGKNKVLFSFTGVSTLNQLLAPEFVALAPDKVSDELIQKVVIPAASAFQIEANRVALEVSGAAHRDDLTPLT